MGEQVNLRQVNPADHIGLVRMLARLHFKRCYSSVYEEDDLVQAGLEAACRAVHTYDPARGKFSTYLSRSALRAMRYVVTRERSMGRVPHNAADALNAAPDITEDDVTTYAELRALKAKNFKATWRLDPANDGDRTPKCIGGYEEAERRVYHESLWGDVRAALLGRRGGERLWHILRRRFIDEWTLNDLGEELNLTRERVRQLQDKALASLERQLGPRWAES